MRNTKIKDKNGRYIHEGHLIRWNGYELVVCMREKSWTAWFNHYEPYHWGLKDISKKSEIIGNVWEVRERYKELSNHWIVKLFKLTN